MTRSLRLGPAGPFLGVVLLACAACSAPSGRVDSASGPPPDFARCFTGRTLRADLHWTGSSQGRTVTLWRLVRETRWAGPRRGLVEDLGLGDHRMRLLDAATGAEIYRQGFSTLQAEWLQTAEALAGGARTFPFSVRFPEPRRPCRLAIERREGGRFEVCATLAIDPSDPRVVPSGRPPGVRVRRHGPRIPTDRALDLVFLGDGYTRREERKFLRHVERLREALLAVEPFASAADRIVVRSVFVPSQENGVSHPRRGLHRRSALGVTYDVFGSARYALPLDEFPWREAAACVPYDAAVLLADDEEYGGGGIFERVCVVAARSERAAFLLVHEFGHSFGGLGDEYFTSDVAYEDLPPPTVEPWEPNLTTLLPEGRPKWADRVTPGTPIPTPWPKERFVELEHRFRERRKKAPPDRAGELAREHARAIEALLAPLRGVVGAFEGAGYRASGLYRPEVDCLMLSSRPETFCLVCRQALARRLARHVPDAALRAVPSTP